MSKRPREEYGSEWRREEDQNENWDDGKKWHGESSVGSGEAWLGGA